MSEPRFETTGIVLRAFPLAINAFDICRNAASRAELFLRFKLEYTRWRNDLEFQRLLFIQNLRQLLYPLPLSDDAIEELLRAPGGDGWTNDKVVTLLEERLGTSYGLYMQYIHGMSQTMDEINMKLAVDSDWTEKILVKPTSGRKETPSEFFARQCFKIKLIGNEGTRNRLFKELQEHNDKLEKLLKGSNDHARMQFDRKSKSQLNGIDPAICDIPIQARNVFQALARAWRCQCRRDHDAKLLLQHRTTGDAEFEITFSSIMTPESHKVKLLETDHPTDDVILNLCASLWMPEVFIHGFLRGEESCCRISTTSRHCNETFSPVTLDMMLRGSVSPPLTRSQRYDLSLILASTFLQLLDSPWLSALPEKSDIKFFGSHSEDERILRPDQPYISHSFNSSSTYDTISSSKNTFSFPDALDHLGIMLLELCFGKILEDQPFCKQLPEGKTDGEKKGFKILAARMWLCHVNAEAGIHYGEAVSWCLGGNRTAPPEQWRQEMLCRVIHPLNRCREYFSKTGVEV